MPISIVHIGLPLDHPLVPPDDRLRIAQRLSELRQRMRDAGYSYELLHVSPETGLDSFRAHLEAQPCDALLLGGGLAGNESMSYFMEQIIDATHTLRPKAKILFFNHATGVQTIVERWFPRPSMER